MAKSSQDTCDCHMCIHGATEATLRSGCQYFALVLGLLRFTNSRDNVSVVRRLMLVGSLTDPRRLFSGGRRLNLDPRKQPGSCQGAQHCSCRGACRLTYTTKSNTGGSGSCPIQARRGHQNNPCRTAHNAAQLALVSVFC